MTETIPSVPFVKRRGGELEFEVLTLGDIYRRRNQLDHSPALPHRVQFYLIILITNGTGQYHIDFVTHTFEPGTMLFVGKGQVQAFALSPDYDGIVVAFTESFLFANLLASDGLSFRQLFVHPLQSPVLMPPESAREGLPDAVHLIRQEYARPRDSFQADVLRSLLQFLLLKVERVRRAIAPPVRHPERYRLFLQFVRQVETGFVQTRNAADYARQLSVSYKHLNKVCKEFVRLTAKQCIDEHVILEIRRNLVNSDLSIKEIAYRSGFDEPTNLNKYFRKLTGQTPVQFRATFLH